LCAGLTWALTLTGLRWMGKRTPDVEQSDPAMATVIAGNTIAFCASLPLALPVRRATPADLAVLFYLGAFQIALAYIFLTRSLRVVRGLEAATLLLIEPVLNPFWTWIFQNERPSAPALAGGVLIITAAFAGSWWQARYSADPA
jgi:drug/metabolite transporter, DME family